MLLAIGLLWLFKAVGIELPEHLISLPTLVIVTGLVILVKPNSKANRVGLFFLWNGIAFEPSDSQSKFATNWHCQYLVDFGGLLLIAIFH